MKAYILIEKFLKVNFKTLRKFKRKKMKTIFKNHRVAAALFYIAPEDELVEEGRFFPAQSIIRNLGNRNNLQRNELPNTENI